MTALQYTIFPRDPHAHLFEVTCTVADPDPRGQAFRLPVWIPGSYLVREFARHFVTVRAECDGLALAVEKTAKDTWRVAPCTGPLSLVAEVYAFDLSVRAAYLDATRGYFNGASVFVVPVGREAQACEVEIRAPVGANAYSAWQVATTLPRSGADAFAFGRYRAADYEELIDHPVEMGCFERAGFEAGGVAHDIVVSGRHRGDLSRVARDLQCICQSQIDLFGNAAGSPAPFDRYLFQILVLGDGHGGLEHRSSTSLVCKRGFLPQPSTDAVSDDYRSFLGLASHEYFHAWNVKRIKPAAFVPYDLARENYTRQLWTFEGTTSYYDDLTLVRSGLIDTESYLELVGRSASSLLRNPGQARQSVADSSFDAWIKYYRQDENAPNAIVSYYVKGSLIALALDLVLRSESRTTLDDVMRALWQRYGKTGIGVPEGGVEAMASELSALSLHDFFARHVSGTEEVPLGPLLARFGIRLERRQAEGDADKGGTPPKTKTASALWLGVKTADGSELRLQHVYAGGPALAAGLAPGDVIVAIDGLRASRGALQNLLQTRATDESVELHAFRRDELFTVRVELETAPLDRCWLAIDAEADPDAIARREAWLAPPFAGT